MAGDGRRDGQYRTPAHTHTLFSKQPFLVNFFEKFPKRKSTCAFIRNTRVLFLPPRRTLCEGSTSAGRLCPAIFSECDNIEKIIDPNESLKKEKIESAKYFDASDCETLLNEAGITKNDFKTDKDGAVFWSTKEDESKNMDAAQEWAKNNNAKTLEPLLYIMRMDARRLFVFIFIL